MEEISTNVSAERKMFNVFHDPDERERMLTLALLDVLNWVKRNYSMINPDTWEPLECPVQAGIEVPREIRYDRRVKHYFKTQLPEIAETLSQWYDAQKSPEEVAKFAEIEKKFDTDLREATIRDMTVEQRRVLGL